MYTDFEQKAEVTGMAFGFARDVAVDLGSGTVRLWVRGRGLAVEQPCVTAVDTATGKLLKVGEQARQMLGRTPGSVCLLRPVRRGVVADYEMTRGMVRQLLGQIPRRGWGRPRMLVGVPTSITPVEERAVIDTLVQAGGRGVYLMEIPLAAAIGAGLDIACGVGMMVVDIGSTTTDVGVISLGEVVMGTTANVGGEQFDWALVKYVRRKHNLLIGTGCACQVKERIGGIYPRDAEETVAVKGRCPVTGLPRTIELSGGELPEALSRPAREILESIRYVLEHTPTQLVGDITDAGITLTGGGSALLGLDKLIQEGTGIPVRVAEDGANCVIRGLGEGLDTLKKRREGMRHISRSRQAEF